MLPDDYNEDDEKEFLKNWGSPVSLANGYLDRPMHLIGPRYVDVYTTLLKNDHSNCSRYRPHCNGCRKFFKLYW